MGTLFAPSAPDVSDAVLLFELAVGVVLIAGMFLVRRGHVRAHMYIQGSMILVNIPVVLAWMVPEYLLYVLPGVPGDLGQTSYWAPTLMLVGGAVAEVLGIYILLVAGSSLLPERWRFRKYKMWMRTELLLWWLVLLTGIGTYYVWYVQV